MEQVIEHLIEWQNIQIKITHIPKKFIVVDHIEIKSIDPPNARLPMTDTGYKSDYPSIETMEHYKDATEYVLAWLEHDAKSKEWLKYIESQKQGCLF